MDFDEVIRRRRMVRHFISDPIPASSRDKIIEAGLRAPSAGYSQGYSLLVLEEEDELEQFWEVHNPSPPGGWTADILAGVRKAPTVIAVLVSKDVYLDRYAEPDKGFTERDEARWSVPYWYVDGGCVSLLILLAAVSEGLGALLFGFEPEDVLAFRQVFGVPDSYDLVGCVAIGHPDPAIAPRNLRSRRRTRSELVHQGRWGRSESTP